MIKYTHQKLIGKWNMCLLRVGEKITSVLTGLERLRGKSYPRVVLKRLVLVLMDLNQRLDGRGSNSSWAGWDESWEMRVALPNRRCWYSISRLGRSLSMIREAVFTTLFNLSVSFCVIDPNHTVNENIRTLDYSSVKVEHDLCGQTRRS